MATKDTEGSRWLSYSTRQRFWDVIEGPYVVHLFLVVGVIIIIAPIVWTVITSLQTNQSARIVDTYLPSELTLDTLYNVLINAEYWKAIYNTVLIASAATIVVLILGVPAGYIFSRYRFPFDSYIFLAIIAARMFPPIGLLVPYFEIIANLGLLDTKIGIIFANIYLWLPLVIYMMRNFFMSIPKELDESARIDGCTKFQSFRKISLPLAAPGIAASAILTFLFTWREFLFALTVSSSRETTPVSVAAFRYLGDSTILWADLSAAAVLAILPPILVIVFFHRYIISGLTSGAMKG